MIHTPAAQAARARRVARTMAPAKRKPLSEDHKAKLRMKIYERMDRGEYGNIKLGKCARKIEEHEMMPILKQMGALIRDARLAADIPQSELSAASGVAESTIAYLERGIGRRKRQMKGASVFTIFRLALALGMRPYELMP